MQQQKGRKRKLLIMLPLFVAPVVGLVLLFSGKQKQNAASEAQEANAFNAVLPSANLKEEGRNKLELYMQAQKDSAKQNEVLQQDPFAKSLYDPAPPLEEQQYQLEKSRRIATGKSGDANERMVNERLDKLLVEINKPTAKEDPMPRQPGGGTLQQSEVADLEKLLTALQTPEALQDPEMARIETVLEKVLDIQHPERVKQKLAVKKETNSPAAYTVTTLPTETAKEAGFYGLEEQHSVTTAPDGTTILAAVPDDQVIQDGATIKLRLLQPVFVGNIPIPKGTLIAGKCAFSGDRVTVQIKDIVYRNNIYGVNLTAYDTDGLLGINVPGTMNSDVLKNGTSQAIQDLEILNTNPSVAAQAAATGIQTVKNLLTKKVKAMKATIKAGHQVLLKTSTY